MKNTYNWILVLVCAILGTLFSQLSLFIVTLPQITHLNIIIKVTISICLLLIQLGFMVYYIQIGIEIMDTISLVILVFLITFIMQLITNYYIFGNKNTIDDYVGMLIMIVGIIISKTQIFG
jgi:hypothetical protein